MVGGSLILSWFVEHLAEFLDLSLVVDLISVQFGLKLVKLLRLLVRSGAPKTQINIGKLRSKDETRDQQRVVLIGRGCGAYSAVGVACIGVPPLSPLSAFPRIVGDALQRGLPEKDHRREVA